MNHIFCKSLQSFLPPPKGSGFPPMTTERIFYEMASIFFVYSFLAWVVETAAATLKVRDFRNRGFVSGPFCFVYGFTGVLLTIFLQELKEDKWFLFLGSMVIATAVEWMTGKLLERLRQKKWWDYSGRKWNFNGYICLQYSLLWGILGSLAVRYGNRIILGLYRGIPVIVGKTVIWGLIITATADILGSLLAIFHMEEKLPYLLRWNHKLQRWTLRLVVKVSGHIEKRIVRSYPSDLSKHGKEIEKGEEKCRFVQVFWLFVIGAFAGDIVEMIFCRITMGVWMSRSSLVWGHFSVVWGLAIALVTVLLYKDRSREEHYIFWVGFFLGGAYEYICSVFTEIVFGKVFWDYSAIPFNLGGRINLLYCFFWGIAAVVWMKVLYPKAVHLIEIIRKKTSWILTGAFLLFMIFNIFISILALVRYDTRAEGKAAVYRWEQEMDQYFGDAKMEQIYPNAIKQ